MIAHTGLRYPSQKPIVHLWLSVTERPEQCVDLFDSEGEIGVRVKPENLGRVDLRERLDVFLESPKLLRATGTKNLFKEGR